MAKCVLMLKSLILKEVLYGQPSGFWLNLFLSFFFFVTQCIPPLGFHERFLMAKDSSTRKDHIVCGHEEHMSLA